MTTAAVVLAGGAGSRFHGETHKLLTVVRGRRIVDWAVGNAADAGLDDLIVVTGMVELDSPAAVRNDRWQNGLAASLWLAVTEAGGRGHDAVVVGHGDQPGIPPSAWRAVAAATDTPMARALYATGPGHPVRLHRSVWPLLPRTGDQGAAALLRERPQWVTQVACEGDATDVDTLEDLRRWS